MGNRFSNDIRMEACEGYKRGQLVLAQRVGATQTKAQSAASNRPSQAQGAPERRRM